MSSFLFAIAFWAAFSSSTGTVAPAAIESEPSYFDAQADYGSPEDICCSR